MTTTQAPVSKPKLTAKNIVAAFHAAGLPTKPTVKPQNTCGQYASPGCKDVVGTNSVIVEVYDTAEHAQAASVTASSKEFDSTLLPAVLAGRVVLNWGPANYEHPDAPTRERYAKVLQEFLASAAS